MKKWIILLGIAILGVAVVSASGPKEVKERDKVSLHYTLTLDDGTVYGTSYGGQPLQVTLGEGKLLAGFEEAVIGMRVGESKTVTIPPEKAYGQYHPELVQVVDRSMLPADDQQPEVGQRLQAYGNDGVPFMVTIIEVTDTTVTADSNPPLAGEDLTFKIELLAIEENSVAQGSNELTKFGWILLTLGIIGSGLVFFYRMNRRGLAAKRIVLRARLPHRKRALKL